MPYKVLVDIENDKTNKSFEPGAMLSGREFPKDVIEHWVRKGFLEEVTSSAAKKITEDEDEQED